MAELTLLAVPENLSKVNEFINREMELTGCTPAIVNQVDLAVEELYVNIAHYAYHPKVGQATIRCEAGGDPLQITIEFLDGGKPYNPLEREDPDITGEPDKRQIGGLGVYLVKNLMDDISYEYRDGKNILTIRKKV